VIPEGPQDTLEKAFMVLELPVPGRGPSCWTSVSWAEREDGDLTSGVCNLLLHFPRGLASSTSITISCESSSQGIFLPLQRKDKSSQTVSIPFPLPSQSRPTQHFFPLECKSLEDTKILLAFNIFNNLLFI
jgi:hypothetical protein